MICPATSPRHSRLVYLALAMLVVTLTPAIARTADPDTPSSRATPKPIASDPAVKYDYDIVYVRAPRRGDSQQIAWAEVFAPLRAEPGSDLVLLHPDGSEDVLVR